MVFESCDVAAILIVGAATGGGLYLGLVGIGIGRVIARLRGKIKDIASNGVCIVRLVPTGVGLAAQDADVVLGLNGVAETPAVGQRHGHDVARLGGLPGNQDFPSKGIGD